LYWRMVKAFVALVFLLTIMGTELCAAESGRLVAVAWNDQVTQQGKVQRFSTVSPWTVNGEALPVGLQSSLRFFAGRLYATSYVSGSIVAIDVPTWVVIKSYPIGANSEPLDIAVVSESIAYVTTRTTNQLLKLNLDTGVVSNALDLTAFSHPPGSFMAGTMVLDGDRLIVAMSRFEPEPEPQTTEVVNPGGYLVLVDTVSEQIMDADAVEPGIQAIELQGTFPKYKMSLLRDRRRLYVSASGGFFDEGGLEEVNLDTLKSMGLIVEEADGTTGADLLSFTMTKENQGYLNSSTDLLPSSHLARFSLTGGANAEELFVTVDYHAPNLIFDPPSNTLFVLDGGFQNAVWVFDAEEGETLNEDKPAVPLGGIPSDLELLCDPLQEFDCKVAYGEIPVFESGFEAAPP